MDNFHTLYCPNRGHHAIPVTAMQYEVPHTAVLSVFGRAALSNGLYVLKESGKGLVQNQATTLFRDLGNVQNNTKYDPRVSHEDARGLRGSLTGTGLLPRYHIGT